MTPKTVFIIELVAISLFLIFASKKDVLGQSCNMVFCPLGYTCNNGSCICVIDEVCGGQSCDRAYGYRLFQPFRDENSNLQRGGTEPWLAASAGQCTPVLGNDSPQDTLGLTAEPKMQGLTTDNSACTGLPNGSMEGKPAFINGCKVVYESTGSCGSTDTGAGFVSFQAASDGGTNYYPYGLKTTNASFTDIYGGSSNLANEFDLETVGQVGQGGGSQTFTLFDDKYYLEDSGDQCSFSPKPFTFKIYDLGTSGWNGQINTATYRIGDIWPEVGWGGACLWDEQYHPPWTFNVGYSCGATSNTACVRDYMMKGGDGGRSEFCPLDSGALYFLRDCGGDFGPAEVYWRAPYNGSVTVFNPGDIRLFKENTEYTGGIVDMPINSGQTIRLRGPNHCAAAYTGSNFRIEFKYPSFVTGDNLVGDNGMSGSSGYEGMHPYDYQWDAGGSGDCTQVRIPNTTLQNGHKYRVAVTSSSLADKRERLFNTYYYCDISPQTAAYNVPYTAGPQYGNLNVVAKEAANPSVNCAALRSSGAPALNSPRIRVDGGSITNGNYTLNASLSDIDADNYTIAVREPLTSAQNPDSAYDSNDFIYCVGDTGNNRSTSSATASVTANQTTNIYIGFLRRYQVAGSVFYREDLQCNASGNLWKLGNTSINCNTIPANPNGGSGAYTCINTDGSAYFDYNTSVTVNFPTNSFLDNYNFICSTPGLGFLRSQTVNAGAGSSPNFILGQVYDSWFQTKAGDVHAEANVNSPIPPTCLGAVNGCIDKLSLDNDLPPAEPGLVSYNTALGYGDGDISSRDWKAKSGLYDGKRTDYAYWNRHLGDEYEATLLTSGAGKPSSGIYKTSGGAFVISNSWTVNAGEKIVIVHNGSVEVQKDVTVAPGGALMIASSGNISFTNTNKPSLAQGVYIADGQITTNAIDAVFEGQGTFVGWGGFSLQRNLRTDADGPGTADYGNNDKPAETFIYRPDIIFNLPEDVKRSSYDWLVD